MYCGKGIMGGPHRVRDGANAGGAGNGGGRGPPCAAQAGERPEEGGVDGGDLGQVGGRRRQQDLVDDVDPAGAHVDRLERDRVVAREHGADHQLRVGCSKEMSDRCLCITELLRCWHPCMQRPSQFGASLA